MNRSERKIKKLGDICEIISGSTPKTNIEEYWGGDYNWVTPAELSGEKEIIDETERKITQKAIEKTNLRILPKGTVLLSSRAPIGKVAIAGNPMYCNQGFKNLICSDKIYNRYLFHFLKHKNDFLNSLGRGATFKEISKKIVSNVSIPLPKLSIQEKIVKELDVLNDIIAKKKEQLSELDTLAQATFYEMFGDPIENKKGWEIKKIKDSVTQMFIGPFGSALKKNIFVPQKESYCMIYEQKHAIKKTLKQETHYINEQKYKELQRFEVVGGDFIMSCRGTIGQIYRLPNDAPKGIIHPSLMKIRINGTCNSIFFEKLLTILIKEETTNGGTVKMAITAKELGKRNIIIPPITLQNLFAERIHSIETQKELINKSIKEVQQLFDYTMDKYFN